MKSKTTRVDMSPFSKILERLSPANRRTRIFEDWMTMAICGFHTINVNSKGTQKDPANEELYMKTIKDYSKDELEGFVQMLAHYQNYCLHNNYRDGLGDIYMEYFYIKGSGQFFTPTEVCSMMAQMNVIGTPPIGQRVLDPACGSGRTLLAFAELAPQNLFFGMDINQTCVKMCVINCFLSGLTAEIAWGNSLSVQTWKVYRINWGSLGIHTIDRKESFGFNYPTLEEIQEMEKQHKIKEAEEMKKRLEEGKKVFQKADFGEQLNLF